MSYENKLGSPCEHCIQSDVEIKRLSSYIQQLEKMLGKMDDEYLIDPDVYTDEERALWQTCHSRHYH